MNRISNLLENESRVREVPPGEVIFHAGDPGETMYVVQDGEVDILVADRVVETVGPDGLFGEMAMVDQRRRSATALTRRGCRLVPIHRGQFDHLALRHPVFTVQVMRALAARLQRLDSALAG